MFLARNLGVLAVTNGHAVWHYGSDDPLAAVMAGDYFAAAPLKAGDFIHVSSGPDGAVLYVTAAWPNVIVRQLMATREAP